MKDFVKSTKFKLSLLCLAMIVIGIGMGMLINASKTIPTLSDGTEVIAEIDGKQFTANDLYSELKTQGGETVLTNLIDEYIASQEMSDTTDADDYAASYVESLKSQYESYGEDFDAALTNAGYESIEEFQELVAKDQLKSLVADEYIKNNYFDDKEINDYYDENIEGAMTVRYILITPEEVDEDDENYDTKTTENEEAALATANEVIEKLKNGEDFADLATEYSDDESTASEGGLYSGFTKDEVVEEFWNASAELEDGKYTNEPVKSSYGYFVILRVNQDDKPSLEDSKDEVLEGLLEDLKAEDSDITTKAWIDIRKSYNLNIVDDDINKAYKNTISAYED